MIEAKRPSGDRHFYAIAISSWDRKAMGRIAFKPDPSWVLPRVGRP